MRRSSPWSCAVEAAGRDVRHWTQRSRSRTGDCAAWWAACAASLHHPGWPHRQTPSSSTTHHTDWCHHLHQLHIIQTDVTLMKESLIYNDKRVNESAYDSEREPEMCMSGSWMASCSHWLMWVRHCALSFFSFVRVEIGKTATDDLLTGWTEQQREH